MAKVKRTVYPYVCAANSGKVYYLRFGEQENISNIPSHTLALIAEERIEDEFDESIRDYFRAVFAGKNYVYSAYGELLHFALDGKKGNIADADYRLILMLRMKELGFINVSFSYASRKRRRKLEEMRFAVLESFGGPTLEDLTHEERRVIRK